MIQSFKRYFSCLAELFFYYFNFFNKKTSQVQYQNINVEEVDSNILVIDNRDLLKKQQQYEQLKVDFIPPQNIFKDLIQEKAQSLISNLIYKYFQLQRVSIQSSPMNLKIFYRLNQIQGTKLNQFVYEGHFPCTLQRFQKFMSNGQNKKLIDNNIKQFQVVQIIDQNTSINYIQYKKMFAVPPRDYVYLNYSGYLTLKGKKTFIQINTYISDNKISQSTKCVRGQIILSGCLAWQIQGGIQTHWYNLINMYITVTPLMVKQPCINQIKRIMTNTYSYFQGLN